MESDHFRNWGVSGAAAATVTAQALVSLLFFAKAVLQGKGAVSASASLGAGSGEGLEGDRADRCAVGGAEPDLRRNFDDSDPPYHRMGGDLAVAAQRVGSQIESVSWMVGDGFSAAVNAFLGQNYGAKRAMTVRRGYFLRSR